MPHNVDAMLNDCFFAVGQAVGDEKQMEYDAIVALRNRYRDKFLYAVNVSGNSWDDDRDRVIAVSRWLGRRTLAHAADRVSIDASAAHGAATDIEAGCRMSRARSAN